MSDDLDEFGLAGTHRVARASVIAHSPEDPDLSLGTARRPLGIPRRPPWMKQQLRSKVPHTITFEAHAPPQAETAISVSPGMLFRGHSLVSRGEHDDLFVTHVRVGTRQHSWRHPQGPIALKAFAESLASPFRSEFLFDTSEVGQEIVLTVKNTGHVARNVIIDMVGEGCP